MRVEHVSFVDETEAALLVKVDDVVYLRARVLSANPAIGAVVELFSKTTQQQIGVRWSHVEGMEVFDPPPEPADGSWVAGTYDDRPRAYHRNDAGAPTERETVRCPKRWFSEGEWMSWPQAILNGADPGRVLVEPALAAGAAPDSET